MKDTKLPHSFLNWYWDLYSDGCECPSYVRMNESAEYGYGHAEYSRQYNSEMCEELQTWLLTHKTSEELKTLLDQWFDGEVFRFHEVLQRYDNLCEELNAIVL